MSKDKGRNRNPMSRLAAIDIGTNTILLLVADIGEDGRIFPLRDLERTTRLGQGLAKTGRLHLESIERSLHVIEHYLNVCRGMGVERIFVVGTSALRTAANSNDLVNSVYHRFNLTVRIISGEEEASLAYLAVQREMPQGSALLVLDIGGGSVEFILGKDGRICNLYSLDIGAVRLTERFLKSDPVADGEFEEMADHIAHKLRSLVIKAPKQVVGLGGTITTISAVHWGKNRVDPSLLHGSLLTHEDVNRQVLLYKRMSQDQRRRIPGLPRERADIILAGTAVLSAAMNILGFRRLIVSCRGLRYGLLHTSASGQCIEKGGKSC